MGQKRRFGRTSTMSGLLLTTDIRTNAGFGDLMSRREDETWQIIGAFVIVFALFIAA
jgi:hypothetical protein